MANIHATESLVMLKRAESISDEIVRIRRDLHQHPELGFEEVRTSGVVADQLQSIGLDDIRTQVGRTGVTVQFGSGDGPTIGIRADMDALPIHEATDVPFKSTSAGVMHACGHDCHTAMLLGVARLLHDDFTANRSKWKGNVRLLFQPCEEKFDENGVSGATAMIQDAALEDVDQVIALHIISSLESGKLQFHDGFAMAAVDSFEAKIKGDGGHGAYPHLGRDPLFMLSSILPALFGMTGRRISPLDESVVSLGEIHAGSAENVIPKEVFLHGTIRSFDHQVREQLWQEVENCFRLADAMGGSYEFTLRKGYPSVNNSADVNVALKSVAKELAGGDAIIEECFGMGGEDFAYMAQSAPGAMFLLGAQVPGGGNHHTPIFDIDETVLPMGSAVLAETARRFVT
jgi:amidohydrolase